MRKKHTQKKYPNFLAGARRTKGYRYKQVARKLQLKSTRIISLWENGTNMPGGKNLIALSLLYDRDISDLYPILVEQLREQFKK